MNKENLILFGILLISFIIYAGSLNYPFHFDDNIVIINNQKVAHFLQYFSFESILKTNHRWVSILSFAISHQLGGEQAIYYRIINILIHLSNGILVYSILQKIFRISYNEHYKQLSLLGAAFFLLHPIQSQPVVYIAQQMTLLSTFFFLIGFRMYIDFRTLNVEHGKLSQVIRILMVMLCLVLSIGAKQNGATFLIAILGLEWFLIKDNWSLKATGVIGVLIAIGGLFYISLGNQTVETTSISRLDYLYTQFGVLLGYLKLIFIPFGFSIDHHPQVQNQLFTIPVLFPLLVHFSIIISALYFSKRFNPLIGLGVFLFYSGQIIESTIFPIRDLMFEHRTYLSMIGLSVLIPIPISILKTNIRYSTSIALGLVLAVLAIFRIQDWKSGETIWKSAIETTGPSARAHCNLGYYYLNNANVVDAKKQFEESLIQDPNYEESLNNLGYLLMEEGRYVEAIHHLNKATAINPRNKYALNNLAVCWEQRKAPNMAAKYYRKALVLDPTYKAAIFNLAVIEEKLGQIETALEKYLLLIELQKNYKDLHFNMGNLYLKQKDFVAASNHYKLSIQQGFSVTDSYSNLSIVKYYADDIDSAIYFASKALELDDSRMDIKENLSTFYSLTEE